MRRSLLLVAFLPLVALTLGAAPTGADAEGAVLVGSGWTDPSTLDVVGWEGDPATFPAEKPPVPQAIRFDSRTVAATCGNRKDWYRVIEWSGRTQCFSNRGEIYKTYITTSTKFLCPGNNVGASYYRQKISDPYSWSLWRDGHSNWNKCYQFSAPMNSPEVVGVRIK